MDEDIHRIIKTTVGKFGTIHILINNVCPGYMLTKRQEEIIKKRSSDQNLSVEEYMT
jgi:NAD(P)-dependent dehydrogenase (short-subunit alcohol dehydrogenase family)